MSKLKSIESRQWKIFQKENYKVFQQSSPYFSRNSNITACLHIPLILSLKKKGDKFLHVLAGKTEVHQVGIVGCGWAHPQQDILRLDIVVTIPHGVHKLQCVDQLHGQPQRGHQRERLLPALEVFFKVGAQLVDDNKSVIMNR